MMVCVRMMKNSTWIPDGGMSLIIHAEGPLSRTAPFPAVEKETNLICPVLHPSQSTVISGRCLLAHRFDST